MNVKNNSEDVQPKNRKLKKLYAKIRKQMEFYFSDSNLVKDKFLTDLIAKDPNGFVELDIFRKFNKIRALTNSCEVIATSVSRSDIFEISEDRKKIRRITPLALSKDFDACTLYVEKLPQNADTKWVKDNLGHFGSIMYVNVPRFKVTNKIKGFAFVEFESPEGVKNACEFYKILSEKECSASEDESKNVKNAKKHKHNEVVNDKKNKKNRSISESSDKLIDFSSLKSEQQQEASEKELYHDKEHSHQKGKRKRRREDSGSDTSPKKYKEFSNKDLDISTAKSNDELKTGQAVIKLEDNQVHLEQMTTDEEKAEISDNLINGTTTKKNKTKRKRKSSKKHSNAERPTLRVMPKSEWKTYRNKYLELQRSTMSIIKKQILQESQELKDQETHTKSAEVSEAKKSLHFVAGVIIKVTLAEPVKNPAEIKTQVKANAVVAYVDAPMESSDMFVRCLNPEDALNIIKEDKLSHLGKAEIIKDDEEKKYWEKLETDRRNKFSKPVIHKKRGRDKLIAKAAKLDEMKNKHIYFDD